MTGRRHCRLSRGGSDVWRGKADAHGRRRPTADGGQGAELDGVASSDLGQPAATKAVLPAGRVALGAAAASFLGWTGRRCSDGVPGRRNVAAKPQKAADTNGDAGELGRRQEEQSSAVA
ncbi:hypothetical protein E2562_018599 [Oryza meyeriana var. granulata]|uniref:DUF834 domain-containing protein n=1 Tax=Oryza meyeriana var. granulata TaxID=110450 RepID=A0A6G1F9C8_9ORYZ|nr:hypothetical protein E2562_018599 [Oryza meyeriana var. granulata]